MTPLLFSTRLSWDEVRPAAEEAFAIWVGHPEIAWAQHAWQILGAAGLTAYSTTVERGRVVCRFLTLAGLYRAFCRIAWDEANDPDYVSWAETLDLGQLTIGQLLGDDVDVDGRNDYEVTEGALTILADRARQDVVAALKTAAGGDAGLFLSLWRSIEQPDDDGEPETDDEILNYDVTPSKVAAYEWITEGCPP
jgi:hypothetical protein